MRATGVTSSTAPTSAIRLRLRFVPLDRAGSQLAGGLAGPCGGRLPRAARWRSWPGDDSPQSGGHQRGHDRPGRRSRFPRRDFRVATASQLAFADGALAGYRADKVLHAVADSVAVLAEAQRVLARAGGSCRAWSLFSWFDLPNLT